jgi:hypothetical protein
MFAPPFLDLALAAIVFPIALWVAIAKIAENHPGLLPRVYDVVEMLTWGLWIADAALLVYCLNPRPDKIHSMRVILFILSAGVQLVYSWIRRRVDPVVRHPGYGWWPAGK